MIRKLTEQVVFSNRFFTIYNDIVAFPDGKEGTWVRIVEPNTGPGVAILPVCNGQVGLVQNYRYAISSYQWEIPRGRGIDSNPEVTAKNELYEELGAEPAELIHLGTVTPNSAHIDNQVEMYYAKYDVQTTETNDRNEVSGIQWVDLDDFRHMIVTSRIIDSFTLAAVAHAQLRKLI